MPAINVDKNFEQGRVRYGEKMARRLAISGHDLPWDSDLRQAAGLEGVIDRLGPALVAMHDLRDEGAAEVRRHPEFLETNEYDLGFVVRESGMVKLAEIWEMLEDVANDLPPVECWCVCKVRHEGILPTKPSVWTGHMTREQADAFAPAIAAHYAGRASHTSDRHPDCEGFWGGWSDRFVVARSFCGIRSVVGPDLEPAEYVRWLGR